MLSLSQSLSYTNNVLFRAFMLIVKPQIIMSKNVVTLLDANMLLIVILLSLSSHSFPNSGVGRNDVVIIVDGLGSVVSFTILVSIGVSFPPAKTQSQQRRS